MMRDVSMKRQVVAFRLVCVVMFFAVFPYHAVVSAPVWKAGISKTIITPQHDMWLAGYAARNQPSSGKLHDLWAKCLVLEDAVGERVVLVSTDLLGFPRDFSKRIKKRFHDTMGLEEANMVLNSSHTHSGPVLGDALADIYELDEDQQSRIDQYTAWLEDQLVALVQKAADGLEEAQVAVGMGFTTFQVNRRNNSEATITQVAELFGPNDYRVGVLKVSDKENAIKALLFNYACHPTVLDGYEWSGDYAGFTQMEIERAYPGSQALFFQGAGGDQNPLPRKTVALARQFGKTLAAAVLRVVEEDAFTQLEPHIQTAYAEHPLPFASLPDRRALERIRDDDRVPSYFNRWAKRKLGQLDQGKPLPADYPYPIQCIKLGQQLIFALGGELVTQYSIALKDRFGPTTLVYGYSNDVMGYIPSERILEEGGYEGDDSQKVFGLPAKWAPGIEKRILDACQDLYNQLK